LKSGEFLDFGDFLSEFFAIKIQKIIEFAMKKYEFFFNISKFHTKIIIIINILFLFLF